MFWLPFFKSMVSQSFGNILSFIFDIFVGIRLFFNSLDLFFRNLANNLLETLGQDGLLQLTDISSLYVYLLFAHLLAYVECFYWSLEFSKIIVQLSYLCKLHDNRFFKTKTCLFSHYYHFVDILKMMIL